MNDQVSDAETKTILSYAESALALGGDFVELGCYRGDTSLLLARLIKKFDSSSTSGSGSDSDSDSDSSLSPNSDSGSDSDLGASPSPRLWLYDSFAGLPEKSPEDSSSAGDAFKAGELFVSKSEVVLKFKKAGLRVPKIKKAFFEELIDADLPEKIAFAFLDGDLYKSIKTSLKLVEDKMVDGGIIIVHDYNNPELPGTARATDEWHRSKVTSLPSAHSRPFGQAYGLGKASHLAETSRPANQLYQFYQIHSLAVFRKLPRKP